MFSFKEDKASSPIAIFTKKPDVEGKNIIYMTDPLDKKDDTAINDLATRYEVDFTQKELSDLKKLLEAKSQLVDEIKTRNQIEVIPRVNSVERLYIAAPSGSGKSYFTARYVEKYRRIIGGDVPYPVFLFSAVDDDDVLDNLGAITRINLEDAVDNEETMLIPETYRNSIVIFDDVDSIQEKSILKKIYAFRDAIMTRGRHENILPICTNHLATDYKSTRVLLNEMTTLVIFPRSGSAHGSRTLLTKYCGIDIKMVTKLLAIDTRWLVIYKNYPLYCVHEHGVIKL
jgi:hypothetical protein